MLFFVFVVFEKVFITGKILLLQNCQILLSKIKLSNDEIVEAIYSMDIDDRLSKDMLEQMLKFVPSSDEQHLLDGHSDQLDMFAKADRFLYEMSRLDIFLLISS